MTLPGADLSGLQPKLLESGAGGLAWWKLSRGGEIADPRFGVLHDAFRYQIARLRMAEKDLTGATRLLEPHGVRPILGKGWAAAGAYAVPALRPTGDIDLYVRPDDFECARDALRPSGAPIDLHRGCPEIEDSFASVADRAVTRRCGDATVLCFEPSDHLRLVIRHFFRHGAWRPLWLCDIAALLEFETLDWNRILGGSRASVSWIVAATKLARDLLGARLPESAPLETLSGPAPPWLVTAVLAVWGRAFVPHGRRVPMAARLARPGDFVKGLRERWPNAIEAAIELGLPADAPPSLPLKVGASLRRTSRFLQASSN